MNTQNRNDDLSREQDTNRDSLTVQPAMVSGVTGKSTSEHFSPTDGGQLERLIDYSVIDRDNDKIGSVDAVWADHTGQPTYLAVRTGWLGFGKAHVVPAQDAEVNEDKKRIRLPYTQEQVKNAPSFDSQEDINEDSDFTISSHFGTQRVWTQKPATAEPMVNPPSDMPRVAETVEENDTNIKLREEALRVGKREVEYGGVRLRKIIRTETVNQPIELSHEEIVIERVPVSGAQAQSGQPLGETFDEKEIYIPLRREEAVVEKTTRTREEIHVGKRREKDQETIHEELRHEDVEIEHEHEHRA